MSQSGSPSNALATASTLRAKPGEGWVRVSYERGGQIVASPVVRMPPLKRSYEQTVAVEVCVP